ncbi:MAG: penicillin-binding protein 2 [Deltaproteobacteria bacterium]|nr:penicillin-binding protein 2 [Deltaproteobacteria bacterium]
MIGEWMFPRNKIFFMGLVIVLFFAMVCSRLLYLQLFKRVAYQKISENFSLKETPLLAQRGILTDCKGRVLATTRPSFNLFLTPQKIKDTQALFEKISKITGQSQEIFSQILEKNKKTPKYKALLLMQDLNSDQAAQLNIFKNLAQKNNEYADFSAIDLKIEPLRTYPQSELFSHPLGFVRNEGGDWLGVQGLEKFYEATLRGVDGKEQTVVDAFGREMNALAFGMAKESLLENPLPGKNLQLTLDRDLQEAANTAFGNQSGALALLELKSGDVLALVSKPSFNANQLLSNISAKEWKKINEDELKPLLNRTLQAAYPPGSTFKIVTALTGLMEGKISPQEKFSCPGYYMSGGRRFSCWNAKGHGQVDFYHALMSSCDVYFYKLGERLGVDRIAEYAKRLGLGQLTGIDLDYERSGLIPSSEWKKRVKKEEWNPSETLSMAIGQGYDLVTPLQNALMMATVASGGKKITPHLVKNEEGKEGVKKNEEGLKIPAEIYKTLMSALKGVVQDPGGTAHRIALPGVEIGGKTGTAQVVNYDTQGRKAKSRKTEDHAWFVAYAPAENPEIALAVVVEHGGHGGAAAAPIAQAVLKKYFEVYHNQVWKEKTDEPRKKSRRP